jgi:hypothetical protein
VIGLEGACQLVTDRLEAALPGKTAELRTRLGAQPDDLPDVITVIPHELARLELEQWPAVMVVGQNLEQMVRDDVEADGTTWLCTYRLRVWVWARGNDFGHTDRIRKRLTLAVRELLMQLRRLAADGQIDDRSIAESYSDLDVDNAGATIGGSWLEFLLVTRETLGTIPIAGLADDVVLDTGALPQHPAL